VRRRRKRSRTRRKSALVHSRAPPLVGRAVSQPQRAAPYTAQRPPPKGSHLNAGSAAIRARRPTVARAPSQDSAHSRRHHAAKEERHNQCNDLRWAREALRRLQSAKVHIRSAPRSKPGRRQLKAAPQLLAPHGESARWGTPGRCQARPRPPPGWPSKRERSGRSLDKTVPDRDGDVTHRLPTQAADAVKWGRASRARHTCAEMFACARHSSACSWKRMCVPRAYPRFLRCPSN
jgi:hypothetical protein